MEQARITSHQGSPGAQAARGKPAAAGKDSLGDAQGSAANGGFMALLAALGDGGLQDPLAPLSTEQVPVAAGEAPGAFAQTPLPGALHAAVATGLLDQAGALAPGLIGLAGDAGAMAGPDVALSPLGRSTVGQLPMAASDGRPMRRLQTSAGASPQAVLPGAGGSATMGPDASGPMAGAVPTYQAVNSSPDWHGRGAGTLPWVQQGAEAAGPVAMGSVTAQAATAGQGLLAGAVNRLSLQRSPSHMQLHHSRPVAAASQPGLPGGATSLAALPTTGTDATQAPAPSALAGAAITGAMALPVPGRLAPAPGGQGPASVPVPVPVPGTFVRQGPWADVPAGAVPVEGPWFEGSLQVQTALQDAVAVPEEGAVVSGVQAAAEAAGKRKGPGRPVGSSGSANEGGLVAAGQGTVNAGAKLQSGALAPGVSASPLVFERQDGGGTTRDGLLAHGPALEIAATAMEPWAPNANAQTRGAGRGAESGSTASGVGAMADSGPERFQGLAGEGVFDAVDPSMAGAEDALTEQVAYWVHQNIQNARLTVRHDGQPVEVSVSLNGNEAHVSFGSDEAQTRDLIDGSVAQLRDMLRQEGLVLSGVTVGESDRRQQGSEPGRDNRRDAQGPMRPVEHATAATPVGRVKLSGDRAVDIFV